MRAISFRILLLPLFVIALMAGGCKSGQGVAGTASRQDSIAHIVATKMLKSQQFLMTSDRIHIGGGPARYVSDNTNFILVEGDKAVVQVSPGLGGGPNGVGGFTVKGTVGSYKIKENTKGEVNVSFHVSSPIGSCDVRLSLYGDSSQANAYVTGTFHRGRVTMYGEVRPSDTFRTQGRSL